jgi:hypothetical protein
MMLMISNAKIVSQVVMSVITNLLAYNVEKDCFKQLFIIKQFVLRIVKLSILELIGIMILANVNHVVLIAYNVVTLQTVLDVLILQIMIIFLVNAIVNFHSLFCQFQIKTK